MKITIGIPAYNEEKNIASIITKLKKITDSIIVCDDGSSDMTSEISKNLGAIVISHKKNMGYGYNYKLSFDFAIKNNYEKIIFIHGDGQYPPSQITKMSGFLNSNTLVFGSRFLDLSSV